MYETFIFATRIVEVIFDKLTLQYRICVYVFFFPMNQQLLIDQGFPIIVDSLSHPHTPHPVGLLWTSDRLDTEATTCQHTTLTRDKHPCLSGNCTHNPSERTTAEPRLRPRGYRYQRLRNITNKN
jgi:hypothetical protein